MGFGLLLFSLIFILPIILLLNYFTNHNTNNSNTSNQNQPPTQYHNPQQYISPNEDTSTAALKILNERYARGEIDDVEFKKRKDAILGR